MQKVFEVALKIGTVPVYSLPHITPLVLSKVQQSKKFKDYLSLLENAQKGVEMSKIEILGVQMFGENVGFINMRAITTKDGHKLPSYVFLRGNAVAILMFVNQKVLLVQQYRVPAQKTQLQAPAGMIDESGDFVGVAAKQIEEQTSIKIKKQQLIPLTSYYPSVGGCDQQIFLYYCKINVSEYKMKQIQQKIHGVDEHERIRVRLVPYDPNIFLKTKDSKLIYALYAYENLILKKDKSNL